MRWLALGCVLVCGVAIATADEASLLRGLDTDDPQMLSAAVHAIEAAPTSPELADVLFAAGRACEDRLQDPVRALAVYERITRELPDASVSIAAARRIAKLATVREHPEQATALARLEAEADRLPVDEVVRRFDSLVHGDADAEIWLADFLCRTGRFTHAQARYARHLDRELALRNAAGCALDAHDWSLAEQLAHRLPADDVVERAVRDDLVASAARGRLRNRLYGASWVCLVIALLVLVTSLAEATWRGGWRRPSARPPVEVLFLAPVALVLVFVSFTAHRAIAPAVARITIGGLALAWLSGIALDVLRSRGRAVRARAVGHVVACVVAIVAIGYIAMTRDGLLDMLAETVKFGPGA